MYVKTFVKSALIATTAMCGLSMGGPWLSAEAAEFYTRKRVNGVWITGHFPKKQAVRAKQARPQPVVASADDASTPATPVLAPAGPVAATPAAPVQPMLASVSIAATALVAPTVTGALPPSGSTAPDLLDNRAPMFQRAFEARQAGLLSESLTQAPAAGAQEARLLPLQRALEARAKSMGVGAAQARAIKVVTFNFETGLRTSVYDDGSVVEERFDPVTAPLTFARR